MMQHESLAFIGGGQMATALITGALRNAVLDPQRLAVVDNCDHQRDRLKQLFPGIKVFAELAEVADYERILLAIKPQVLRQTGPDLSESLAGERLWISIAAGVSLAELSTLLGSNRIVRVMPNTPSQLGAGAAGLSAAAGASEHDITWVTNLMRSVGICERVAESHLHAVTGIAGSSPAYIYLIVEAMSDAGVAGGLPRELSLRLSAQAVLGAARMILETGKHPGQLKDQVTSPAGTTIAALEELEAAGVRGAMMQAVAACIARSRELETNR